MTSGSALVGRIAGLYGLKGWVKVISYTEPRKNILGYQPWFLERDGVVEQVDPAAGREQGKGLIAQITGVEDRDTATGLIGANILVNRESFARDLIGLRVTTIDGVAVGVVECLLETGANDVLVVQGDYRWLIPFIMDDVVKRVDFDAATIVVDWDVDWDIARDVDKDGAI